MSVELSLPTLAGLDFVPYIDCEGHLPASLEGQVGIYGIFNAERVLQYVGYSRNIALSLRLHLVRQPQGCYWVKAHTVDRPRRAYLEATRDAWLAENGEIPPGNARDVPSEWENPIDVKAAMTDDEIQQFSDLHIDERTRIKVLKRSARRIEADILAQLEQRNLQEPLRFNPKLKEQGLLDLKT